MRETDAATWDDKKQAKTTTTTILKKLNHPSAPQYMIVLFNGVVVNEILKRSKS
jgi:hypothetical protein